MKLLESFQKKFAVVGQSLYYSKQKYHLNVRNVTVVFLMSINLLGNAEYIFYGAESFAEYLQYIYVASSLAFGLIVFIIAIVLMPETFMLIDNFEQIINKSEYTSLEFNFI